MQVLHRIRVRAFTTREKPRHTNGNAILKLSLNMMTFTPEHEKVLASSFLTTIKTNQTHLTHVNDSWTWSSEGQNLKHTKNRVGKFPSSLPQSYRFCGGTDTDPYMEAAAELRSAQPNFTPTNFRSTKYEIHPNPKPNYNHDYRY